jgi:signal transduction histidine kinase/ActR/RegA family two-component response regulator
MDDLRQVEPKWNKAMIVASIAISFLGAFTSTQLMCHAKAALQFSSVFVWSLLGSLIFGFCSIWGLHFLAMLAYEFDIPIGVNAPLTILSAVLAVLFTFLAMSADLLWDRYRSGRAGRRSRRIRRSRSIQVARDHILKDRQSAAAVPLLETEIDDSAPVTPLDERPSMDDYVQSNGDMVAFTQLPVIKATTVSPNNAQLDSWTVDEEEDSYEATTIRRSSRTSGSDQSFTNSRQLSTSDSNTGSFGLRNAMGFIYRDGTIPTKNAFVGTAKSLYFGMTPKNIVKGAIWSLAITSMHYVGIVALEIPSGHFQLNIGPLILSALISWSVCTVGFILMQSMETRLGEQVLFSVLATTGVAGMHFTGMAATTFWSRIPPSADKTGFPPALAGIIVGVAFITCIVANVLLSHSATVSRNKLAEVMWTRKELYKNIALKEHAEAAARSRSEFIASASHEIRTPLHHLQGYSDLLAQTQLTEEGRVLLTAIQRATKTLSLLTNNVLDWSKFEGNAHGEYRPTPVDIRGVCESIVTLLPNAEDDSAVEIYVVVAPTVPVKLMIDDSWIHRILMNLLSNALKFTTNGYILLSLEMDGDHLVANVKDTGCGLDPAFISDMFTPFKQGEVRGSSRGTGLGLSIIRQLVQRMNGSIDVESLFEQTAGVGPENAGTTFTVSIPVNSAAVSHPSTPEELPKIAILSNTPRSAKGLQTAWKTFRFDTSIVASVSDLGITPWKYVWAELGFLVQFKAAFSQLIQRKNLLILIPYDTQDSLDRLPGILTAPNVILLPKPLLWHNFSRRILATRERKLSAAPSQALRFAPEVEVFDSNSSQGSSTSRKNAYTILLVEDNSINRKLGSKMLNALGYKTLLANDGEEALTMLRLHNDEISCVLMDQSMPKMDGVTATSLIRKMESEGRLNKGRPIIAVTAVVNSDAKEEFRIAGADDFLSKPLSLERLRDVLGVYLPAD